MKNYKYDSRFVDFLKDIYVIAEGRELNYYKKKSTLKRLKKMIKRLEKNLKEEIKMPRRKMDSPADFNSQRVRHVSLDMMRQDMQEVIKNLNGVMYNIVQLNKEMNKIKSIISKLRRKRNG